ncbi:MAG: hypothetical protein C4576_24375 [Desulfobacteraceae bacterium]|nr:MAG: hypothetical protein C4576_24375 [Desulfobacteraceae bacterium]
MSRNISHPEEKAGKYVIERSEKSGKSRALKISPAVILIRRSVFTNHEEHERNEDINEKQTKRKMNVPHPLLNVQRSMKSQRRKVVVRTGCDNSDDHLS